MTSIERLALAMAICIAIGPAIPLALQMYELAIVTGRSDIGAFVAMYLSSHGPMLVILLVAVFLYVILPRKEGVPYRRLAILSLLVAIMFEGLGIVLDLTAPEMTQFELSGPADASTERYGILPGILTAAYWLSTASGLVFILVCAAALVARLRRRGTVQ